MRKGWREVPLAEVINIKREACAPNTMGNENVSLYSIPGLDARQWPEIVSPSSIGSNKFRVSEPSVLFSLLNPRIPRFGIAEPGSYCSTEFAVMSPLDPSILGLEYLALIASDQAFQRYLQATAKGTTGSRARAKAEDIRSHRIMLPPLAEQGRIVDLIGSLDESITAARDSVAEAAHLLERARRTQLSPADESWTSTTLGAVAERVIGRTPPRNKPEYWTADADDRPFCTIATMNDPRVRSCAEGVTADAEKDGVAKRVPAGALLLSFKLSLGRIAVPIQDVFPNEAIAWVKPNYGIDQEFLRHSLLNVDWNNQGSRAVKGKTLNKQSLDAIELSVPSLRKQREIAQQLLAIEDLIARGQEAERQLSDVRFNMLTTLLSGEHEIPESYDDTTELAA